MKILAIAYACEPNRGSEPGVGWNWVRNIAQLEKVQLSVITRSNNKPVIENFYSTHLDEGINFVYYDLPKSILKHKKGDKSIKLFYSLWQMGVIKYIKNNINLEQFDYIWDFNFGSLALPTFVHLLKKPYLIGPASTKEGIPKPYLDRYSMQRKLKYHIQQFMREHLWTSVFTWKALKGARVVVTCNEVSRKYLPKSVKSIAVFHNGLDLKNTKSVNNTVSDKIQFIYAGRLIDSKNLETAIRAFGMVSQTDKNFRFEIYGNGPEKNKLKNLVDDLGLSQNIIFCDKINQQQLFEIYQSKDCFVFPSLLEVSSTAVMEAMYFGMTPICLDISCMEYILDNEDVIKVSNVSPEEDSVNMAQTILDVMCDKEKLVERKIRCSLRARECFLWEDKQEEIFKVISLLE